MICNTFRKQVNEYGNTFYYPVLKDYIHCEQFKKERGKFGFEVPAEVKCKKALPVLDIDNEIYKNLSKKNKILGTTLLLLFISEVTGGYPEVICTEIQGGQYLKFQFQYFFTHDFMNVPFMMYKPVGAITKKEASKYLVCIDQE